MNEKPIQTTRIKHPQDIIVPLVCENRDDFTKFVFSLANIFTNDPMPGSTKQENMEFCIESLRTLLHEYLALVFTGKLEPYRIAYETEEDRQEAIKEFRAAMMEINVSMARSGVPMVETDGGRVEIDFDKLKKQGDKEFGNGQS